MSHKQEGHKIRNVVIAVGCTATPVQTAASVINTTEFELLFPWSAGFVFFLPSDTFSPPAFVQNVKLNVNVNVNLNRRRSSDTTPPAPPPFPKDIAKQKKEKEIFL